MFCPLCKSEYRVGFGECSDCHSKLVATRSEANNRQVTTLWKGHDQTRFEDLLTALQCSNIAHRFLQYLKYSALNHSDYEYEIRILLSDYERGNEILARLEEAEKAEDWDVD